MRSWIDSAQDRDLRTFVNAAKGILTPQPATQLTKIFLLFPTLSTQFAHLYVLQ